MSGPVASALERQLRERFNPDHLDVQNESHQHNVPAGSETHFKVVVVTERFEGLSLVARHRAIHEAAGDLLAQGIHALSIQAHTPEQWEARGGNVAASPRCRGGDGRAS